MRGFVGASYELLSFLICMVPAVLGVCFAFRPCERLLALMRPLTLGAVFAALCVSPWPLRTGSPPSRRHVRVGSPSNGRLCIEAYRPRLAGSGVREGASELTAGN
jgi:hypothetical protein